MENREALEQNIAELEASKVALFDSGSADPVAVGRLNGQINEIRQQLSAIDREEAIDVKVSAEDVPFSILGINLDGYPTPIIDLLEEVYRMTRKYTLNECAIDLEQVETKLSSAKEEAKVFIDANIELQGEVNKLQEIKLELEKDNRSILEQNGELSFKLMDTESKRDAADEQLTEAKSEIARLNQVIADYEQAEEYRQRQDQPINVNSEETTSLQEKADAVKKLFVGRENWGTVDKLYLPDGSFQVVKRADVETDWEEVTDVPSNEVIEAPQFPSEIPDAHAESGVDGNTTTAEGLQDHDGGEVTRAEFEALRQRVSELESRPAQEIRYVNGEAA